jgi:hypothetical protein
MSIVSAGILAIALVACSIIVAKAAIKIRKCYSLSLQKEKIAAYNDVRRLRILANELADGVLELSDQTTPQEDKERMAKVITNRLRLRWL